MLSSLFMKYVLDKKWSHKQLSDKTQRILHVTTKHQYCQVSLALSKDLIKPLALTLAIALSHCPALTQVLPNPSDFPDPNPRQTLSHYPSPNPSTALALTIAISQAALILTLDKLLATTLALILALSWP